MFNRRCVMTILLFGVFNIGVTVTGELLAQKLKYGFFDLNEKIKIYNTTLEILASTGQNNNIMQER